MSDDDCLACGKPITGISSLQTGGLCLDCWAADYPENDEADDGENIWDCPYCGGDLDDAGFCSYCNDMPYASEEEKP